MMSRNYADYQSEQPVYTDWQQPYQFHAAPQPLPYQPDGHQKHHLYHARQPTSWDPPWLRQTTTYQQLPSYEPDMYSPPPPGRRPTCWDPPADWETPGQRPFHEVSAYGQPLPPASNSSWSQPAPQPPYPATAAENPIEAMLDQLLAACKRMESRLDAIDRRIDNDAEYGSLKPMNEFILDEVGVTCPLNFDMVMIEDNKANDGGDQPMDAGDHPMESGGDAPNVSIDEKSKSATTRQNGKLYAEEDALLEALESIQIRPDLCQQISNGADGVTTSMDHISKWSRFTDGEGRIIQRLWFSQSQQIVSAPIMMRFGVEEYNRTARSCTFDPGGDISAKLLLASVIRHHDLPLPAQPYHQGAPQQQSTSSSIELPPYYAAPRPWQPLQPLPVTAPLFASDGHLQPGVSSSRKKEEDANLPDGEEKLCEREERLIEPNRMFKQNEKENDSSVRREKEVNKDFSKLIEKEIKSKHLNSKLETKENDLRVLFEKPSKNVEMEIQSLVAIEIKDHDLEVEVEEKRGVFEFELRLKSEELVQKESAIGHTTNILKKRGLTCAYDPGGMPKPLFATLFVVSWFPP